MKNFAGVLMGIALNLQIAFGKIGIFTLLILPTKEIFPFSGVFYFFFKNVKFLTYRSSTCLVRITPRYFMLFVAIMKGDVSLISFSAHLSSV